MNAAAPARATPLQHVMRKLLSRSGQRRRPPITCLCGSTRFRDAFEAAARTETLGGRIVLSVGVFGHLEPTPPTDEQKRRLDALHLRKIDLADEILVLNVGGYIGESTRREIAYARRLGRRVRYLERPVQNPLPTGISVTDAAAA